MDKKGIIRDCAHANCGFKCCSFGNKGHVLILPFELLGHEGEIKHLQIINDNYFGGKKVRCRAKNCMTCDGGYKPIMCRSYPLWVRSVSKKEVFKSRKCPLPQISLTTHKDYVLSLFEEYSQQIDISLDDFLSKAWIDNYEPLVEAQEDFNTLSMCEYDKIITLERELDVKEEMCMLSEDIDIRKSLLSGCSKALVANDEIIAYTLAYNTDYGTAYVDKCYVRKDFRGKGMQAAMLKSVVNSLLCYGVHEIYAMVSPKNEWSMNNFRKVGFSPIREMKCNGYDRIILKWEL